MLLYARCGSGWLLSLVKQSFVSPARFLTIPGLLGWSSRSNFDAFNLCIRPCGSFIVSVLSIVLATVGYTDMRPVPFSVGRPPFLGGFQHRRCPWCAATWTLAALDTPRRGASSGMPFTTMVATFADDKDACHAW